MLWGKKRQEKEGVTESNGKKLTERVSGNSSSKRYNLNKEWKKRVGEKPIGVISGRFPKNGAIGAKLRGRRTAGMFKDLC